MLYINTPILNARAQKGWWTPVEDVDISFTLRYDPADLGLTGRRSLRRWARRGYCDRPTGQQAALWQMLMWKVGARHITLVSSHDVTTTVLGSAGKLDEFKAKLLLLNAANDMNIVVDTRKTYDYEQFKIEGTNLRARHTVTLRRQSYGYACLHRHAETLVAELGHPLRPRQLEHFMQLVDCNFEMRVIVNDRFDRAEGPTHRKHTNVTRLFP